MCLWLKIGGKIILLLWLFEIQPIADFESRFYSEIDDWRNLKTKSLKNPFKTYILLCKERVRTMNENEWQEKSNNVSNQIISSTILLHLICVNVEAYKISIEQWKVKFLVAQNKPNQIENIEH